MIADIQGARALDTQLGFAIFAGIAVIALVLWILFEIDLYRRRGDDEED